MKLLIYAVLVVILCFVGSHSYEIACQQSDLTRCVNLIMSMRLSEEHMFAAPNDQLEAVCSRIETGENCIHEIIEPCVSDEAKQCIHSHETKRCNQNQGLCTNYKLNSCQVKDANKCINGTLIPCIQPLEQRCVGGFTARNITNVDDPLLGTTLQELELIHEEKKGFCFDGKIDPEYKKHQHCLAVHHKVLAECRIRLSVFPLGRTFDANLTEFIEFIRNNETMFGEQCCEFYQSQACVRNRYEKLCGSATGEYVAHILKKASDRNSRCECDRFKEECSSSATIALSSTLFIVVLILIIGKQ